MKRGDTFKSWANYYVIFSGNFLYFFNNKNDDYYTYHIYFKHATLKVNKILLNAIILFCYLNHWYIPNPPNKHLLKITIFNSIKFSTHLLKITHFIYIIISPIFYLNKMCDF